MIKIVVLLLLFYLPLISLGQDTTFYKTGSIERITKHRQGIRLAFYSNGKIKRYLKSDKLFRQGKEIDYDSLGNITSKGNIKFSRVKHGKWIFYDSSTVDKKTFKFGIDKATLYTSDGKRKRCYLTYGKGCMIKPCTKAQDKYRVQFISVSGCIMERHVRIKARLHNCFVTTSQSFRYGIRWKQKAFDYCKEK
jgi:hypothetical protein